MITHGIPAAPELPRIFREVLGILRKCSVARIRVHDELSIWEMLSEKERIDRLDDDVLDRRRLGYLGGSWSGKSRAMPSNGLIVRRLRTYEALMVRRLATRCNGRAINPRFVASNHRRIATSEPLAPS
jgi:hypothetical protein